MTAAEFKKKWSRYQGKETSAYQEHFDDLCRLLGQATPAEADPSGRDSFCFQKRVVKDAELFDMRETPGATDRSSSASTPHRQFRLSIVSAIRSFMLPEGFSHSSFTRTSALAGC